MLRISAHHWWLTGLCTAALHGIAIWAVLRPSPAILNMATLSDDAVIQGALIQPAPPAPTPTPTPAPAPVTTDPVPARPAPAPALNPDPASNATARTVAATSPPLPADRTTAIASAIPVVPPRLDATQYHNPAPPYPDRSRRLREEGTVVLDLWILPDGRVGDVQVADSSGHARLDAAAREAVRHWRYTAARQGGQAIAWRYRQPVVFSLNP